MVKVVWKTAINGNDFLSHFLCCDIVILCVP